MSDENEGKRKISRWVYLSSLYEVFWKKVFLFYGAMHLTPSLHILWISGAMELCIVSPPFTFQRTTRTAVGGMNPKKGQ
jgi:hypothetical protein